MINSMMHCIFIQTERQALHARAAAAMRQMQDSSGTLVVSLPLFTVEEMRVFVESVLGDTPGVRKLAQIIWEITGGWPLYAEQV